MTKHSLLRTELSKLENALWLVPLDPYLGSEESQLGLKTALDLIRHNNAPEAIRVLKRLVKADPDNCKLSFLLGSVYMDRGAYNIAMRFLAKGRRACLRKLNYLLMHAELLEMDGFARDDEKLLILLYRIADIRLCDVLFQYKLQDCLIRAGAYRQAMRLGCDGQCR